MEEQSKYNYAREILFDMKASQMINTDSYLRVLKSIDKEEQADKG